MSIKENNEQQNTGSLGKMKEIFLNCYHRILHNFGWKVLSLVMAFLVWMAIMNLEDPYISVTLDNIPVSVLNESALQEQGKISDIESGRTISLKVKAPRSVAENLTNRDFEAIADFRQMSLVYAVPIQVKVSERSLFAEENIIIESRSPEVMMLSLEDYSQETFRVDINANGEAANGFYISNMMAKPNLLQVSGSARQIERIAKIVVDVDTAGVATTFERHTTVYAYDKNGYQLEEGAVIFETEQVSVEVTVLPVKKINLEIELQGEPSYGYSCTDVQYVPNEITIAGAPADLTAISSFKIPFDISLQSKTAEAKLNIENYLNDYFGEQYVLVDDERYVNVKATIEKLPTTDIKASGANIEVRNLSDKYRLDFTNKNDINIKVLGQEEKLSGLTVEDLKLYVDVADLEPGYHYISVYSDYEGDVTVREGTIGIRIYEDQEVFVPSEPGETDEDPGAIGGDSGILGGVDEDMQLAEEGPYIDEEGMDY